MQKHNSREKTLLKSLKLFVAGSGSSQFVVESHQYDFLRTVSSAYFTCIDILSQTSAE
ncbi:hypothetical protein [Methanosarcina barkeri]|uniref:hypothetical protein n=1 Tax=Methanosarcina barkeri TaxID=2208 RepID=UPI000A8F25B0|nr:hypothetical protein [Methanosarcina barkeri]